MYVISIFINQSVFIPVSEMNLEIVTDHKVFISNLQIWWYKLCDMKWPFLFNIITSLGASLFETSYGSAISSTPQSSMMIGTAGLELILVVDVKICQDDIYGPVLAHDLDIVHPHDHGHPLHHLAEHHVVTVQEIPVKFGGISMGLHQGITVCLTLFRCDQHLYSWPCPWQIICNSRSYNVILKQSEWNRLV